MSARSPVSWIRIFGVASVLLAALACAPKVVPPLPAHPFPKWVAALEPGTTSVDQVLARFGDPDDLAESPRGGTLWRYRFPEVQWPDDDPMRPRVASDGSLRPPARSALAPFRVPAAKLGRALDRLLNYPPTQPRPPRRRRLPATIHALELHVAPDGVLQRVRYRLEAGETWVPMGS